MITRISRTAAAFLAATTLGLTTAATLVTSPATATASPASKATTQLSGATIPASCDHAATTLSGTSKDFGDSGFAELETGLAGIGRLRGAGRVITVPLNCSSGGASAWPQYVLVYRAKTHKLLGSFPLRTKKVGQEHEMVTSLRIKHGVAHLAWEGYDGAGYNVSIYHGVIRAADNPRTDSHAKIKFHRGGPLTIDYQAGQNNGGAEYMSPDSKFALLPAPKSFVTFVAKQYRQLVASAGDCASSASIEVERYSHLGFAVGGEGACGGAGYLWARVDGKWKTIQESQDYPACSTLTKLQRRAYVALAQTCWNPKTQKAVTLGHWPTSGI